jgi:hypothetical protein
MSTYLDLTDLAVETRGHSQIYDPSTPGRLRGTRLDATIHTVRDDDTLTAGFASVHVGTFSCATCDAYPSFDVRPDPEHPSGVGLRARTECALPDGVETVFTLNVTSGRIVVADDLRPVFDFDLHAEGVPGYNSLAGQAAASQAMAAQGCAYGATGNVSLSLIRTGADRYVIASVDDEAEPGEEGYLGEVLATICTGLWAYSIADYEHWAHHPAAEPEKALLAAEHPDAWAAREAPLVVDFPNGAYEFTHHATRADFDADGPWPRIYSDITKVG